MRKDEPVAPLPAVPPTYAGAFRCIGADCEDTCCQGWSIPLDQQTYQRYQQFPAQPLGALVFEFVAIAPNSPTGLFARIRPRSSGTCPFFTADRLCSIQREYGGQLLSATCSTFPRTLNRVPNGDNDGMRDGVRDVLEGSLSLSCPEAARNILLNPRAMQVTADLHTGQFRTDGALRLAKAASSPLDKPFAFFHPTRVLIVRILTYRALPLWQRVLFLGSLCGSLDSVTAAEADAKLPSILEEHQRALDADGTRATLDAVPSQAAFKLSVFFRLSDARMQDKDSGVRFRDTFWAFIEGIGGIGAEGGTARPPNETASDVERYLHAEQAYYLPFVEKSPFLLENYLLNYVFQNLFPFGRENDQRIQPRSIFEEYVLLAAQFAWIETLLIGTAGRHRQAFCADHIVHVVQSFCRAVEHNPRVLSSVLEFLAQLQLDTLPGIAILLRN